MPLLRYKQISQCHTQLDPLQDCMTWIRGLRSKEYTEGLLREKHQLRDANKIRNSSRAIAAHAISSVALLEQAFSSSSHISFLPIYYAMLNLSKMAIISRGWLNDLKVQRLHGAHWSGINRDSQGLLTDHITVHEKGAIGLFYKALVDQLWPKSLFKTPQGNYTSTYDRRIYLRDLYPYIASISYEYENTFGAESKTFAVISVDAKEVSDGRWRLEVEFPMGDVPQADSKRKFKILSGLDLEDGKYVSNTVRANNADETRDIFSDSFRWFLIHAVIQASEIVTVTAMSKSNLLLPDEIPILLVFFHLGNVVRYDPERLERLFDSRASGLLENLRRHATYDFLLSMWSFLSQSQILPFTG